ncbi:hypothetical protein BGZ65_012963, partial [Modicella reniformis]
MRARVDDPIIALMLCHDTEVTLDYVKKASKNVENQFLWKEIATTFIRLKDLLNSKGYHKEASAFHKKSEKWGCLDRLVPNWNNLHAIGKRLLERIQPSKIDFKVLATDVIKAFMRDEKKDAQAIAEVAYLAPGLEKDNFRYLLNQFYSGIEHS